MAPRIQLFPSSPSVQLPKPVASCSAALTQAHTACSSATCSWMVWPTPRLQCPEAVLDLFIPCRSANPAAHAGLAALACGSAGQHGEDLVLAASFGYGKVWS